jgi:general secretion pathway protein D
VFRKLQLKRKKMRMKQKIWNQLGLCLLLGGWLGETALWGQPFPGGFGGAPNTPQRSSGSRNTTYPSSTDIGQARITYDPETRSIIVVADEATAAHITNVVRQLDRPTPQVLIKCVFMEATYSKGTDIGVKGTYSHTISSKGVEAFNGTGTASTAFDLAATGGMYTMLGKDLEITLAALAQAGRTEILSRPSILARNNQQATITIGQQVPLIQGVTYDSFGNQRNAVSYQNVGIILQVTPFITSDGMVEMVVAPQISSVSDSTVNIASGSGTNTAGNVAAPIINIRSADTVVVVPDGQTVVIGGLMQNQKVKSEEKVPILGDIPLLGLLFKHKKTDDEKKELLIFMTPHIVKHPTELAAHTDRERMNAEESRKAFTEEELNRYFDKIPTAAPPESPSGPPPKPVEQTPKAGDKPALLPPKARS